MTSNLIRIIICDIMTFGLGYGCCSYKNNEKNNEIKHIYYKETEKCKENMSNYSRQVNMMNFYLEHTEQRDEYNAFVADINRKRNMIHQPTSAPFL